MTQVTLGPKIEKRSDSTEQVYSFGRVSLADSRKPDLNTEFEIGSLTKTFTGALLADAVLNSQVKLNDPLRPCPSEETNALCFHGKPITLLDLATHTSGLPRIPSNLPHTLVDPYDNYTKQLLDQFISGFRLDRAPGVQYEYSNLGFGLLADYLTSLEDKSFEQLVVDRITQPLGMKDTRVELTPEEESRFAPGYFNGEPMPHWHMGSHCALAGAGALRSTMKDMLVYLSANMGVQTSLKKDFEFSQVERFKVSDRGGMGLAWQISHDVDLVWHNGATSGSHSFLAFDRSTQTGVVILSNTLLVSDSGAIDPRIEEAGLKVIQDLRGR